LAKAESKKKLPLLSSSDRREMFLIFECVTQMQFEIGIKSRKCMESIDIRQNAFGFE